MKKDKVILELRRGLIHLIHCPDYIEIVIKDYDNPDVKMVQYELVKE